MDPLQQYIERLQSPNAATREAAAQELCELGRAARPAAAALFQAILREPAACPSVGTALTMIGPLDPDLAALKSALHSESDHVRFWAARTVVKIGPDAASLVPTLIPMLCDSHSPVVDSVVWALGTIGIPAVEALIEATLSEDSKLRGRAVLALGRYPENAAIKLPAILQLLDDPIAEVRRLAARAVSGLGQSAHLDRSAFDSDTLSMLFAAMQRIASDDAIQTDSDWFERVHGWLCSDIDGAET